MNYLWIIIPISILLVTAFIIVRVVYGGVYGLLTKIVASLALVVTAIVFTTFEGTIASGIIAIGLLFGLIGDILLDLKVIYPEHNNAYLNSGMLAFGLGHICYILAMIMYIGPEYDSLSAAGWAGLGGIFITPIIIFVASKMGLNFGKFLYQTIVYSFLLSFVTVFSIILAFTMTSMWILAVGFALFLLSDLILSLQYFGGKQDNKLLIITNHAFYYIAQIIILCFIFVA